MNSGKYTPDEGYDVHASFDQKNDIEQKFLGVYQKGM